MEAFLAVKSGGPLGPTWYRAGYRCGETGNVICALDLPASIVEATILKDARLTVVATPDGHVRLSVCGLACEDIGDGVPSISEPIDQLIARSVTAENLHLEEITSADLNSLLQRLQRAVALVQVALNHLPD